MFYIKFYSLTICILSKQTYYVFYSWTLTIR